MLCLQVLLLYKATDNYDPQKEALLERQALAQFTARSLHEESKRHPHSHPHDKPLLSRAFRSFRHPDRRAGRAADAGADGSALLLGQQAVVVDGKVQLGPGATLPPTASCPKEVLRLQPPSYASPIHSGVCTPTATDVRSPDITP